MKILFFITRGDTIGGAQTHVLILATKFLNQGDQVLVCVGGGRSIFCEILEEKDIPYFTLPDLKNSINFYSDLRVLIKMNNLLREFLPDIFSVHSTKANYLARLLNFKKRFNLISTIHGWSFAKGTPFLFRYVNLIIEKLLYRFSSGVIFVCNYDLKLSKKYKVLNKKHQVIYNGVPDLYDEKKLVSEDVKIVMVARFDKQKNQMKLINSTVRIPNIVVEFIGDGPSLDKCKKKVESLNLKNKYIFHGSSKNVKKLLETASLFALISNWEGFPISTIEAMALGLPILVSDVGGAGECVYNGINGYKISSKSNDNELSELIEFMISDKSELIKMGNKSRLIFLDKFSDELMFMHTNKYFHTFLN